MKRKLLCWALTLALAVGLVTPALGLETPKSFPDLEDHWAKPYVEDMIGRGMVEGYGDGLFHPDDYINYATGLAFCCRMMVPQDTRNAVAEDWEERTRTLIPDSSAWFRKDVATCLEMGLISQGELKRLVDGRKLNGYMTKSEFAVYMVRALGLADLAQPYEDMVLSFTDADQIPDEHLPYVYLLTQYGILQGDDQGQFNPNSSINRAVCSTMLSRAIEKIIEERDVEVELANYTDYPWTSGIIQGVENGEDGTRTLRLASPVTGAGMVALGTDVKVLQYNKKDTFTALKEGAYAKVRFAKDGVKAVEVRVTPKSLIQAVEGVCDAASQQAVTVGGTAYKLNRFTQVRAGGQVGGPELIDPAAGYSSAALAVNAQGEALWLSLVGGTRKVDGILTDVSIETVGLGERTTILVTSYKGVADSYVLDDSVAVTVGGGEGRILENHKGRHVSLRVLEEDLGKVRSVAVNTTETYVQGILRSTDPKAEPREITVVTPKSSRGIPYQLSENCDVTYMGEAAPLSKLPADAFVTLRLEGGTVTMLSAWQGYEDTVGTLTEITYGGPGQPTVLEVTRANNVVTQFSIPQERLASVGITMGGNTVDISAIHKGDSVVVTTLYNQVTRIVVTPQAANVTGTVDKITSLADGTWELTLRFSDGSTADYTAASTTTVTRSGNPATMYDVRANSQVSMVTEGTEIMSIQLAGTADTRSSLRGAIYQKDDQARTLLLRVTETDGKTRLVKVSIPSSAKVISAAGTDLINIARLAVDDVINVYGSYDDAGVLVATSVIRE